MIKSTAIFQIFPILPVLICVCMCVSKAECRRIDTFKLSCRRRLLSPLDSKEMKPVNPKGNQFWIFIGKTDAEVEAPILWPSDAKNWLIGKNPDAGIDWRDEEKVEVVGWHHWLDGHEFEQALGVGQGSLACCSPWGSKESDMTEPLNWTVWVLSSMQFYHMCKFVYPLPQLSYRRFHCNRIPSVTLLKPYLSLPILTLILSPWKSLICSTIFSFQNYNII